MYMRVRALARHIRVYVLVHMCARVPVFVSFRLCAFAAPFPIQACTTPTAFADKSDGRREGEKHQIFLYIFT